MLAALALSMGLLLAGCTVKTGMTAIAIRDDKVVALLRACNEATIEQAVLYGDDVYDRGAVPLDSWEFDSSTSEDVELGTVSDIVTAAKNNEFLHLQLNASVGDGDVMHFTSDDLADLNEGEVLIHDAQFTSDVRTSGEDEFAERADRCDR